VREPSARCSPENGELELAQVERHDPGVSLSVAQRQVKLGDGSHVQLPCRRYPNCAPGVENTDTRTAKSPGPWLGRALQ
jgi:hypothetical protein